MYFNGNYIPDINEDDNEKVPEVRQNEISQKAAIGISIGVMFWIMLFLLLKSTGLISALIMRLCIYPVVLGVVIAYIVIRYKNNTIK